MKPCWRRPTRRSAAPPTRRASAKDVRQTDPMFDAATYGNKFLNPKDLEALREGLRKAGLLVDAR